MKPKYLNILCLIILVILNVTYSAEGRHYESLETSVRHADLVVIGVVTGKLFVKELYDSAMPDENYLIKVKVEIKIKGNCKKNILVKNMFYEGVVDVKKGQRILFILNKAAADNITKHEYYKLYQSHLSILEINGDSFEYLKKKYTLGDLKNIEISK